MKLAARGVTILVSSDDDGSGWYPTDDQCGLSPPPFEIEGTVLRKVEVDGTDGNGPPTCCTLASDAPNPESAGWMYQGPGMGAGGSVEGGRAARPKKHMGNCTIFSRVRGKKRSQKAWGAHTVARRPRLYPSWPAFSAWMTAVGATRFIDQRVGAEQRATDTFGSGGGFSWVFNASWDDHYSWQADAVKAYLARAPNLPPQGSYPPGGRATPDVSALGAGYQVLQDGSVSPASGTSASAPAFAAMISLLNEARAQAGKKPLGFLNPWIYRNGAMFTDITIGSDPNSHNDQLTYGFNCTKGWDPVTGMGTPIFDRMLAERDAARVMSRNLEMWYRPPSRLLALEMRSCCARVSARSHIAIRQHTPGCCYRHVYM